MTGDVDILSCHFSFMRDELEKMKAGSLEESKMSDGVAQNDRLAGEVATVWDELEPSAEEWEALTRFERASFRFVRRMNAGRWKRFWTFFQRTLGAGWIQISTYNLLRVYGLENLDKASHERPLLIAANHRSFFDMYVVSTILFKRTRWRKTLFFPVRGRFFYDSFGGLLVNFIMGWWSMFPPFFATVEKPQVEKRAFDKFSLRTLAALCRQGEGRVIGFHPEGTRNLNEDPYTFLRPQPGVGKLVKSANPQVIPVFIAGLGNNLARQVLGNWRGGEPIRVHFGVPLDFSRFAERGESVRVYKEISDLVMDKIAELGEEDKAMFLKKAESERAISG